MDIENICRKVEETAVAVGRFLKEEQSKLKKSDIELKGTRNYVTHIDKAAEKKAVASLKPLIANAGFLTEEGTVENSAKEYTWIIDPLDGTTNYVHGDTPFSVSIALTKNGQTLLGVVYDPVAKHLFSSHQGSKAMLNGQPISVNGKAELKNAYLGFGIPYTLNAKGEQILKNAIAQFHYCSLRIKGSAALEICYVACGRSDAYFHSGLSPWDVAAGAFILQCAGGLCTDFSNGDNYLFGKEMVASNGKIHAEILKKIIN